ncbi:hypothetical protein MIDIC_50055 [Alphaproteobacteria bacterium]
MGFSFRHELSLLHLLCNLHHIQFVCNKGLPRFGIVRSLYKSQGFPRPSQAACNLVGPI